MDTQKQNPPNPHEVLTSWKEIAVYLNRGVRTVQRWEAELGLPVRRPRGKSRSAVMAFRRELDEWMHHRPLATENRYGNVSLTQLDPRAINFLLTEAQAGLTFAQIALSASPHQKEKYERNMTFAQRAYDSVLKFRHWIQVDSPATAKLDASMNRLETELETLKARFLPAPPPARSRHGAA
jgi:hypothetical protein